MWAHKYSSCLSILSVVCQAKCVKYRRSTYVRTVLGVPETEYLSPALDSIEDPDVPISHRTAIVGSTQERARTAGMFGANTGVPAPHTAALAGLTSGPASR